MRVSNLVAKHAKAFNKAHVMVGHKKAAKRGAIKHKGRALRYVSSPLMPRLTPPTFM